ncbi:MAG: hypothetical protein PHQ81_07955, partial [Methanofollis sp.]|nr:hypothetical protein [Methanofollis sp.]
MKIGRRKQKRELFRRDGSVETLTYRVEEVRVTHLPTPLAWGAAPHQRDSSRKFLQSLFFKESLDFHLIYTSQELYFHYLRPSSLNPQSGPYPANAGRKFPSPAVCQNLSFVFLP